MASIRPEESLWDPQVSGNPRAKLSFCVPARRALTCGNMCLKCFRPKNSLSYKPYETRRKPYKPLSFYSDSPPRPQDAEQEPPTSQGLKDLEAGDLDGLPRPSQVALDAESVRSAGGSADLAG